MNNITLSLEGSFKSFSDNLAWIMNEAQDIDSAYFATDANTLVSALSNGSDGASLDTKMTKSQYVNGIGFIEQLNNFFHNASVTTGDYLNNINNIIYGNAISPTKLGDAPESIANRMKVLAQSALSNFLMAKDILSLYYNSELSVIVSGVSGSRMVYGANMDVTQLTQGITLVEQYKKLINNEAVSTGDYSANIAIWKMVN